MGKERELIDSPIILIRQSAMLECPHYILIPSHYRKNGTCRCNDPNDRKMKGWGYKWNGTQWV